MERLLIKIVGFIGWVAVMLISGFCELMCWLTGDNGDDRDYDALDDWAADSGDPMDDSRDQGDGGS